MKTRMLLFITLIGSASLAESNTADCCDSEKENQAHLITNIDGTQTDAFRFTVAADGEAVTRIAQKGKAFTPNEISIKLSDKVAFVNDDEVSHNVYCRGKDFSFNIGAQEPGIEHVVEFTKTGRFLVRCAIHIDMKLIVNVE